MFFSDEPGFYKDGEYGIRIESVVRVVKKVREDSDISPPLGPELRPKKPHKMCPKPGIDILRGLNSLTVVVARQDFDDGTYGEFIGFEPVTLVPFEPKLIDFSLMSPGQGRN